MGLAAYFRLVRAGFVLAREGALGIVDGPALPPSLKFGISVGRMLERPEVKRTGRVERLTRALNRLGPTYVKFGQALATRPDVVGLVAAADLSALQDQMEPFDPAVVPGLLAEALPEHSAELKELSPPIAAASIAQVHKAVLEDGRGRRMVAVKILRPGIKRRFQADIESYYAGARLAERFVRRLRRLRPLDVVRTLDRSARLELDLRLDVAGQRGRTADGERARLRLSTGGSEAHAVRSSVVTSASGMSRGGGYVRLISDQQPRENVTVVRLVAMPDSLMETMCCTRSQ